MHSLTIIVAQDNTGIPSRTLAHNAMVRLLICLAANWILSNVLIINRLYSQTRCTNLEYSLLARLLRELMRMSMLMRMSAIVTMCTGIRSKLTGYVPTASTSDLNKNFCSAAIVIVVAAVVLLLAGHGRGPDALGVLHEGGPDPGVRGAVAKN